MKSIYFAPSVPKMLTIYILSKFTQAVYFSPISPIRYDEVPNQDLPG